MLNTHFLINEIIDMKKLNLLFLSLILFLLFTSCSARRYKEIILKIEINADFSYIAIRDKIEYREEMDAYDKKDFIDKIFLGIPMPPRPIVFDKYLRLSVNKVKIPLRVGNNEIKWLCVISCGYLLGRAYLQ